MKKKIPQKTGWRALIGMMMAIALPVALQNVLTTTGSMVDTIMLGSIGETTVGAVGLCAQFSSLMFAGYWGFIGGGMLFISQYYGAKNDEGINSSYGIMLSFIAIPAFVFSVLATMFPEAIMRLYTDSAVIQEIGVRYLRIVGFAYPLQVLAVGMSALLRSCGMVRIPLAGGIAAVITNCTVNYVLIFGKLGFAPMGVEGAAVGTIAAGIVNILVLVITAKIMHVPYLLEFSKHFRWKKEMVREYLVKCFPIIMNEVLIGVGNMMINIVLGHQIESAVAATAVFRTLEGMVISFFTGFSNAATVLVGVEVGAGEHEEAYSRAWRIIYMCQVITLSVCLLMIAVHSPLLHVMGLSGDSYNTAKTMLIIFTVAGTIRMGNWAQNDTFRASGDPSFGSIMEIVFMFAMVQPVIHLANDAFHWPFLVVFALCYCDEPIRYVIMQIHMYSKKWIRPVSEEGKKTIDAFRREYGITMKAEN